MIIIETCPKCGSDLQEEVICTYPPIHKKHCSACGWTWESGPEEVKRIPFDPSPKPDIEFVTGALIEPIAACEQCSSNPKNGGDGICNCTLAQPKIT